MERPSLNIVISRSEKTLVLTEFSNNVTTTLLAAPIVTGCDEAGTPKGSFFGGKWVRDKTNPAHGRIPWSKDPWANPYGPFFLPLHDAKSGTYTTYGIHGTRGPLAGNFEKPPIPKGLLGIFLDDEKTKYLYCSHGCVRVSNSNISKLFELTSQARFIGTRIKVTIQ